MTFEARELLNGAISEDSIVVAFKVPRTLPASTRGVNDPYPPECKQ